MTMIRERPLKIPYDEHSIHYDRQMDLEPHTTVLYEDEE